METPFVQDLNYLRLKSLIQTAVTPVVRIVFDKYFHSHHPGQLSRILFQYPGEMETMKNEHIILPQQWQYLFPAFGMCILS